MKLHNSVTIGYLENNFSLTAIRRFTERLKGDYIVTSAQILGSNLVMTSHKSLKYTNLKT